MKRGEVRVNAYAQRKSTMTIESHELSTENKLVVFFDICSSSSIVDDLKLTDNLGKMRNMLIRLKEFLVDHTESVGFIVYKFIGDGWILLFPDSVNGDELMKFLENLSGFFRKNFNSLVKSRLQSIPSVTGLTFGIDRGALIRIKMMRQAEYIGRPLNVAARLQSAIKDKDKNPAYKCLLSRPAFKALGLSGKKYHVKRVTRTLRNIQGGQPCRCYKLTL